MEIKVRALHIKGLSLKMDANPIKLKDIPLQYSI